MGKEVAVSGGAGQEIPHLPVPQLRPEDPHSQRTRKGKYSLPEMPYGFYPKELSGEYEAGFERLGRRAEGEKRLEIQDERGRIK